MKKLLAVAALLWSFNALSLDSYSAADEGAKELIGLAVAHLKLPDNLETRKKLYGAIDYVFSDDTDWDSYWLGLNDVSDSKVKGQNLTYMEFFINTSLHGMFFVSFIYDKANGQVLINSKQIRHSDEKEVLNAFSEQQANTEEYEVVHESDNYALTQTKGFTDFAGFSVLSGTAAVVYFDQQVINL